MRRERFRVWPSGAAVIGALLGLQVATAGATFHDDGIDNEPLGAISPPPENVANSFLAGESAFDQAITAYLPIGRSWAGDREDELPLPIGIMFNYVHQWETLRISRIDVTLNGSPSISVPPENLSDVSATTNAYTGTLDVWLLPFLNVYGVFGYSEGTARITADFPPIFNGTVDTPYKVTTLGGGGLVTLGYKEMFVVGNLTYTNQDVNVLESDVGVFIAAPRIGWQTAIGPSAVSLWTGANYLYISKHQFGTTEFGPFEVGFDLDIHEVGAWNAALGGRAALGKRFDFVLEGGIGRRKSILASLAMRF